MERSWERSNRETCCEQPWPKSVCTALFLTDDLLKSNKKREKVPEGIASALTSTSERDNPTISLEQRLKDLEIVKNYHDIALKSLEAWSTTAFLVDPDTEPAPILIKALSTYNETRIESGPHPVGKTRRTLAKAPKKGRHIFAPNSPTFSCASMERGIPDARPLGPPNGEVLYDATPPGTEARHTNGTGLRTRKHQETVSRQLSLKSLFSCSQRQREHRDSGAHELEMLRSCATGRLERPLWWVVAILRLSVRRIMLIPHEWTLRNSRGIVVVVTVGWGQSCAERPCTVVEVNAQRQFDCTNKSIENVRQRQYQHIPQHRWDVPWVGFWRRVEVRHGLFFDHGRRWNAKRHSRWRIDASILCWRVPLCWGTSQVEKSTRSHVVRQPQMLQSEEELRCLLCRPQDMAHFPLPPSLGVRKLSGIVFCPSNVIKRHCRFSGLLGHSLPSPIYFFFLLFFFERERMKRTNNQSLKNSRGKGTSQTRPHLTEPCSDRPIRQQARSRNCRRPMAAPTDSLRMPARQDGCSRGFLRCLEAGSGRLATGTTLVNALRADGSARRRAAEQDGNRRSSLPTKCMNLPWIGETRCPCARSGRTLVRRDASIHHPVGEGWSTQWNAADALTGGIGVASRVGLDNGVCCGCGFYHVGVAGCSRLRWRHTSAARCGAEVAFRWSVWMSRAEVARKRAALLVDTRQTTLALLKLTNLWESEWKELLTDVMKITLPEKAWIHQVNTTWCTNLTLCLKQWKYQMQRQMSNKNGKHKRKNQHEIWRTSNI